jgi:hypothetical protein
LAIFLERVHSFSISNPLSSDHPSHPHHWSSSHRLFAWPRPNNISQAKPSWSLCGLWHHSWVTSCKAIPLWLLG